MNNSDNFDPFDFLIVSALPEERDALLLLLEGYRQVSVGGPLVYYIAEVPSILSQRNYRVAVTMLPEIGNVEAGIQTTRAIAILKPKFVLMVGIAGGIKNKVDLGDVILSNQIIYYEPGKLTPIGPEPRPLFQQADPVLLSRAQSYTETNWHDLIIQKSPLQEEGKPCVNFPRVHFGTFAIGEKVVGDSEFLDSLKSIHSKFIGIEMESYGVARAAFTAPENPGFLAIRGVCDFADEHKDERWHAYACSSAAAFTIGFLRFGPILPLRSLDHSDKYLTATSDHQKTLVAIHHLSMQSISRNAIIKSLPLEFQKRNIVELLINQTDLYNNGRLIDPTIAAERQKNAAQDIDLLLSSHPGADLAYFGIAHIPLLFHLGYQMTNKRKMLFFEFNRYTGIWEMLQRDDIGPELYIEGLPAEPINNSGDVLFRISISNTVFLDEVLHIVPLPIASIHLFLKPSQRDVMVSETQLQRYGMAFRKALDQIHEYLPNRQRVHIFYAGPVSLAVYFGQLISQTIDRRIFIYNYTAKDNPRYSWGLEINEEPSSENFYINVT